MKRLRHLVSWYANRWYLRLVHGFHGCRGEGYVLDADGKAQPCYRQGCH